MPIPAENQVSRDGVKLAYPSSNILYPAKSIIMPDDDEDDMRTDHFRWDKRKSQKDGNRFNFINLEKSFASAELIGYYKFTQDPVDDEISGKQGGGKHSDGSKPKCFDSGIKIKDGKTRLRLENKHPQMINRVTGPKGEPLSDKFIGYRFVKKNEADGGVRIQIWQDTGNNEGNTPANEWKLLLDTVDRNQPEGPWTIPPNDHAETIRIDDPKRKGLKNLHSKWICLSEIKS